MRSLRKKSECRLTNRPIELFRIAPEDVQGQMWRARDAWLFTDVPEDEALRTFSVDRVYPEPKDFCWMDTYDGAPCQAKIRPENIRAQLWACGRHMPRFTEEQERHRRWKERDQARKQEEAIAEWKLEEAVRVYNRLKELGWEAVLPDKPPYKRWGGVGNDEISLTQAEFLALVEEDPEEIEEVDDGDYVTVDEDFFASDL